MTSQTKQRPLRHLAMIMDGNRRWAQHQNVSLLYNDRSKKAVHEVILFCKEQNIPHLSLFALSLENLKNRDDALIQRLFDVLYEMCTADRDRLVDENVRVRFIGSREHFPSHLRPVMEQLEQATASATGVQLNILFCYGAQQELVDATRRIAHKVARGALDADAVSQETLQEHLWTAHAPPPDLIVRTGKVSRLSNFLLYQAAYSELLFVDYYWPEMTRERVAECVAQFAGIQRNFGK